MLRSAEIVVSEKIGYRPFELSGLMKLQRDYFTEHALPAIEQMNRHWHNAIKFEAIGFIEDASKEYSDALGLCDWLKGGVEIMVGRESKDWKRLEELSINFRSMILIHDMDHEIQALKRSAGSE